MDKVEIREEHATPMDAIAPGVEGLKIMFVNVFGVRHADGSWTLIDAGVPFSASRIRSWAEKRFGGRPNAILLTHGHFDHVSAAGELAEGWNVPIYAHGLEFPYLTGKAEYPAPNAKAGGGMMSLLSPLLPRRPFNLSGRLWEFANEGSIPQMPEWTLIETPGHTPGHVSFWREKDRTLLPGDAFCTTKPESFFEASLAQHPELHGPPAYFTADWAMAGRSVKRLAGLDPAVVAPGHGKPLAGAGVAEALRKLAQDFERIAVPDNQKVTTQV